MIVWFTLEISVALNNLNQLEMMIPGFSEILETVRDVLSLLTLKSITSTSKSFVSAPQWQGKQAFLTLLHLSNKSSAIAIMLCKIKLIS